MSTYHRQTEPWDADVTEIIPFNEFGVLAELQFRENCAFDTDYQVIHARELDDLYGDDDQVPLRLLRGPDGARAKPSGRQDSSRPQAHRPGGGPSPQVPRGAHRAIQAGGAATRSRLLIAAMAAGATAAAAQSVLNSADTPAGRTVLAADQSAMGGGELPSGGMQVIAVRSPVNAAVLQQEYANGVAFAAQRAEREARQLRPLYVMPTTGTPTSGFGIRWGTLHAGFDIANAIGTPIYAVSDGEVIDAGPTAGYGMWVRLLHSDGTVTLYGHINTTTVSVGDRVMAGDQIATMGNTGFSTGPHLHLEVHLGGTDRVDPVPWLAQRGLNIANVTG